jgi:RNA polymerase sigma factor (sigma-70 family)
MLSSPTRPASTAQLIVGCRSGDSASWAALVRRYESVVYTVARRNGLNVDDSADVAQATFAALLRQIHDLRDSRRLGSWLATVAHRQSVRMRRRADRVGLAELDDDVQMTDTDTFVEWDHFDAIQQALGRLGEPCQELLTLLFLDPSQPSQSEIADRLGRALGGIGPARGRCLEKLRALLEEDEEKW